MPTEYTARPFVFQGLRWGSDHKMHHAIQPLEDDMVTPHGAAMLFEVTPKAPRLVLNGVYTGAEFNEDGMRGRNAAKYTGEMWHDNAQRLEWAALDSHARDQQASFKMEKDAKRRDEIEELLLPLRKVLHGPSMRHDPHKQQALINAITRALRVPPRANEE